MGKPIGKWKLNGKIRDVWWFTLWSKMSHNYEKIHRFHGKTHVISTGPSSIANCWSLPVGSGCNPNIDERMRNMEKQKNWIAIRRKDMDPPFQETTWLRSKQEWQEMWARKIWQSNHLAESEWDLWSLRRSVEDLVWCFGCLPAIGYFQAYSVCTPW